MYWILTGAWQSVAMGSFFIMVGCKVMRSMSQPTGTTDREYTTLVVSPEFRDKVRVAKAEQGQSYEEYLRQHLPIGAES